MGLFGKLFEKKVCTHCKAETGMFGGHKLADGRLCKKCAAELSPFFDDYENSSYQQICEQLAYRIKNSKYDLVLAQKALLDGEKIGEYGTVLLDRAGRVFAAFAESQGKGPKTLLEQSPDLIGFDQVERVETRIERREKEETHVKDGKNVSYDPPRFEYTFNFYATIYTTHPYAKRIRLRLNARPMTVHLTKGEQAPQLPGTQPLFERLDELAEIRTAFERRVKDKFGAVSFDEQRTEKELSACEAVWNDCQRLRTALAS